MPLSAVDTPALVIDLDAFERNLDRMAAKVKASGLTLRPHAKTHKSPVIALKQMARGAVGVCCQKVSEAETLIHGGVADVLVSNEIVGARKVERLAALAREARVGVCVDAPEQVAALAAAAARFGASLDVLVEIDVGGRRCGVAPGAAAADLARLVAREKHLRFAGLQAYHGSAQHKRTPAERAEAITGAGDAVRLSLQALEAAGLPAGTVSGAGTGTFELEAASGLWTELQPGSYVFMDADYARNQVEDGKPFRTFEHALFVLASVTSAVVRERAVVDAGLKALSTDSGMPEVSGLAGAVYHRIADEHGVLDVARCNAAPKVGDPVLLVPGHCDPTVNLHDWYVGVRGRGSPPTLVEAVWPVAARGAVF
jgi:D-serine deaminase-like pyridoxal phosphate-dependent protein